MGTIIPKLHGFLDVYIFAREIVYKRWINIVVVMHLQKCHLEKQVMIQFFKKTIEDLEVLLHWNAKLAQRFITLKVLTSLLLWDWFWI